MDTERLKILLYNAIIWMEEANGEMFISSVNNEYEWFAKTIGITKDEINELGIDWLSEGDEK